MVSRRTVMMENLGAEVNAMLQKAVKHNKEAVKGFIEDLPTQFVTAAHRFYPTVLRAPTGRLSQSVRPVAKQTGDTGVIGLRSNVVYAHVQHEGFHGQVAVKQHVRKGKWMSSTGRLTKHRSKRTIGRRFGIVRAHTRMMNIKAKKFYEIPMEETAPRAIKAFIDKLGLGE